MKCIQCHKQYYASDNDAGTFKEHFCSEKCGHQHEAAVELYLEGRIAWIIMR